ncbi:MAG: hypothetical protein L0Y57_07305 [Beijerinckiaceae bacterium]|nr:hypothetical protein [Beijerinckiaceae bacterium]
MPTSSDLVSLAGLKSWLDVTGTDDDILLAQLISQLSRAILNVLDRPAILPQDYSDIVDGGNAASIVLRHWPVIEVTSCTVDGKTIPAAEAIAGHSSAQPGYVLDSAGAAPPGGMQRLSLRGSLFASGIQNVKVSYRAGYQVTNEAATVPLTPPYTINALSPYGGWASGGGVTYANGGSLAAVPGNPASGQYAVANGSYSFASQDAGASVLLTYGYIPADLASCCLDWAAERYAYRSRIGQSSKSLGGHETISFIVKDIPDFAARILSPYRRVVLP